MYNNMEITFRVEILVLIAIVAFLLWGHVICACSKVSAFEAFTIGKKVVEGAKNRLLKGKGKGKKEGFSNIGEDKLDTTAWFSPDLSYKKGAKGGSGVQNILNRQQQPVPLPEGELVLFANTPFKPECCPNAYSTGSGCACMTVNQYNYLIDRGGNNVPYSEY
jgi:hypothetical protein